MCTCMRFAVCCLLLGSVVCNAQSPATASSLIEVSRSSLEGLRKFDVFYTFETFSDFDTYGFEREKSSFRLMCDSDLEAAAFCQKRNDQTLQPQRDEKTGLYVVDKLEARETDGWKVTYLKGSIGQVRELPGWKMRKDFESFESAWTGLSLPAFEAVGFCPFPPSKVWAQAKNTPKKKAIERYFAELSACMNTGKVFESSQENRIVGDLPTVQRMVGSREFVSVVGDTLEFVIDRETYLPISFAVYRNGQKDGKPKRVKGYAEQYTWQAVNDVSVLKEITGWNDASHRFSGKATVYDREFKYRFSWLSVNTPGGVDLSDATLFEDVERLQKLTDIPISVEK